MAGYGVLSGQSKPACDIRSFVVIMDVGHYTFTYLLFYSIYSIHILTLSKILYFQFNMNH